MISILQVISWWNLLPLKPHITETFSEAFKITHHTFFTDDRLGLDIKRIGPAQTYSL